MNRPRKPLYVPGPGVPKRTPQLLRDLKPPRPGVPEAIEQVPPYIALPLLFGKAHSEIHEVTLEPDSAEEYGDVRDVLAAIADACGHSWERIGQAASDMEAAEGGSAGSMDGMVAALHGAVEAAALDTGDPSRIAAALMLLRSLASASGVSWDDVEAAAAAKRAEVGGFTGHMFWRPLP